MNALSIMRRISPKHPIALDNLLLTSTQRQPLSELRDLIVPKQAPERVDIVWETFNAVNATDEEVVELAIEAAVDGETFCFCDC